MLGKLCLTNQIMLFEEVTKRIDEGRVVDVIWILARPLTSFCMIGLSGRLDHMQSKLADWIQNWFGARSHGDLFF